VSRLVLVLQHCRSGLAQAGRVNKQSTSNINVIWLSRATNDSLKNIAHSLTLKMYEISDKNSVEMQTSPLNFSIYTNSWIKNSLANVKMYFTN
jgi:hypothetical protein